jgi:hypothetical protein
MTSALPVAARGSPVLRFDQTRLTDWTTCRFIPEEWE